MRMAATQGVLFDYGRTLVTFEYPTDDLLRVLAEFRPRIEAALGLPAPEAETILDEVLMPLEEYVNSRSEDEVEYMDVYRDTWGRAGITLPDGLLHDILDAEQRCWDRAVRVDPDAPPLLRWLGERGVKRGICSNAPFPGAMMRRQLGAGGTEARRAAWGSPAGAGGGRRRPRCTAPRWTRSAPAPSARCSWATESARTTRGRARWACGRSSSPRTLT